MMAETSSRLTSAVLAIPVAIILSVYVKADGSEHNRMNSMDHDYYDQRQPEDDCGSKCSAGCCEGRCCSHDNPNEGSPPESSETIKIVAVVGGFLVLLTLIALCILRYRCMVKIRQRTARNYARTSRRRSAARHSSIFSLTVPPQSLERLASQMSNGDSSTEWGQLVLPPPYSVSDPFTSPAYGGESGSPSQCGEPPPAYTDVVKNVEIVVEEGTSTQGNPAQEESSENPTSTE